MAGGITFLALAPDGKGAFALRSSEKAATPGPPPPVFTALPYLQPGPQGHALRDGAESVVIAWQTDQRPADFSVEVRAEKRGSAAAAVVAPTRAARFSGDPEDGEQRFNYAATLSGLALSTRYAYRVRMNNAIIAEGFFTTRKKRGQQTRFVAFGDNSFGEIGDRMIAYQAYRARPDFVMNTGDNVYDGGLDNEYARYFFPVYNAEQAAPRVGAPLLRSVPFYTVIANHDVHGKDDQKRPVADFARDPDSLAYFTAMHLPLNGLEAANKTPVIGPDAPLAVFRAAAGDRFPRMANYAFDYGDAHFLCLDSNLYVDSNDKGLQAWIAADLKNTDAPWKFVVYHHPAFNVGDEHYSEQHMRVLSPLFERAGVAVVFHGHEHNYQRTQPLRFAPSDTSAASKLNSKARLVPGTFSVDRAFDGAARTKPDGVLYLTTGAGGKHLYDPDMNQNPARWRHKEDNNVEYVARLVSDRHSLTVIDMDATALTVTQVDQWGREIDRFRVTK